MELIGILVAAAAVVLLLAFWFVRKQSKIGGRWGIGLLRADCPRCGTRLPMIRKPTSAEEAMWGGWTCPKCGCKVDKYGHERTAA